MTERRFIEEALSDWMRGTGPDSDIVISSRIRIARNISGLPFPILATNQQSAEVLDRLSAVMKDPEFAQLNHFHELELAELSDTEKQVLVEKHLISPSLANESRNGAVIVSEDESTSIMINEEDHLRIQCLSPGLQIREAWEQANRIDDVFESQIDYAFDEKRGFLTSCPTNVGTGIRASVMMHLPALVMTQQINLMLQAVTQVGLAVRGIYGEGSEAIGNLFQISNQITLGQSESEIIDNLYSVVKQLIEHEKAAREQLLTSNSMRLTDRICRSYGILKHAVIMDSKEAAQRLSDIRLGSDLGILQHIQSSQLNELLVMTQPGFLQYKYNTTLSQEDRDSYRAKMIRETLSKSKS
ncbi:MULTISPECIES: protein arginine kinase [Paenibacillus]|uniref:Protein-arginine kinase n=1 Tax=Paenibacillus alvei TaxID=44250 RepID=A0ABT4EKS5_PAEAL|nr:MULTISPECIES: protein arginine kinase [Paenibacillus]EPY14606.1 ATP:guanido phosphotransferase [Paenibacillus alvei A6-6i-x]MCY9533228.1 protein arginine kinase [Paenibacillus alvei]SDG42899.1 protein arginine kinase [Paenibacillus sp. cl6col]